MKFQTFDLFLEEPAEQPLDMLIARAKQAIGKLLHQGTPLVVAFSGGRDSGITASLVLDAAREFVSMHQRPATVVITTSDTLVESPEIARHAKTELRKMKAYGAQHGISVTTQVVQPNLISTFQVKVLTGRGLPSFAGTQSDCTQDLKIAGQRRYRRELFKSIAQSGAPEPVTCLGTRFDESQRRRRNMLDRGERSDKPVRNTDGELVLSPICYWSVDHLTEYIGLTKSGLLETYTDFAETDRIYAHSAGTNCSVIADTIAEGGKKMRRGGCGTRHGCWACQQAEDKSLENMIEFDPRYEYARGLNKLNKFLRATRYHWGLRSWVGRTIRDGYIAIEPDTYHPVMLRGLTRYMLQLDYDEMMRARRAGEERRFTILGLEMLIAIDALQSLNGVARPFSVWDDYRAIFLRGQRYDIPEVQPIPSQPMPAARFLYVGEDWASTIDPYWSGRRDPFVEAMTADGGCAPTLTTLRDGSVAWDVDSASTFEIDPESATMIAEFELDHLFNKFDNGFVVSGVTEAYKWYLQFGCLRLSHLQKQEHDMVLRRTSFKAHNGLILDYRVEDLVKRSIGYADLPPAARAAWAHKRTTETAQANLLL